MDSPPCLLLGLSVLCLPRDYLHQHRLRWLLPHYPAPCLGPLLCAMVSLQLHTIRVALLALLVTLPVTSHLLPPLPDPQPLHTGASWLGITSAALSLSPMRMPNEGQPRTSALLALPLPLTYRGAYLSQMHQ